MAPAQVDLRDRATAGPCSARPEPRFSSGPSISTAYSDLRAYWAPAVVPDHDKGLMSIPSRMRSQTELLPGKQMTGLPGSEMGVSGWRWAGSSQEDLGFSRPSRNGDGG